MNECKKLQKKYRLHELTLQQINVMISIYDTLTKYITLNKQTYTWYIFEVSAFPTRLTYDPWTDELMIISFI